MTQFRGLTEQQEEQIKDILKKSPNFFSLITLDPTLIKNDKYQTYGKYNPKVKELKLNPKVFMTKDFTDDQSHKLMPMLNYVVLHEVAHDLWNSLPPEKQQEWIDISGWILDPIVKQGLVNLVIPKEKESVRSNWYYDKQAEKSFPRWYSKKSPKEDFCDCYVFIKSGLIGRLEGEIGKQKIHFVEQLTK